MAEPVLRLILPSGGVIEALRLPCGAFMYRSAATGYALYSDSLARALTVLGFLQGRL